MLRTGSLVPGKVVLSLLLFNRIVWPEAFPHLYSRRRRNTPAENRSDTMILRFLVGIILYKQYVYTLYIHHTSFVDLRPDWLTIDRRLIYNRFLLTRCYRNGFQCFSSLKLVRRKRDEVFRSLYGKNAPTLILWPIGLTNNITYAKLDKKNVWIIVCRQSMPIHRSRLQYSAGYLYERLCSGLYWCSCLGGGEKKWGENGNHTSHLIKKPLATVAAD